MVKGVLHWIERDPPNVSITSCPHGSNVGINCAITSIRSNSWVRSSSVISWKDFGSFGSCTVECSAATISFAEWIAVSISDEVVFLGVREATFRGGDWGCVWASLRVPFAVTGVFFVKEALAAAYPRVAWWKLGWNWTRAEEHDKIFEEEAIQPKRPRWVVTTPR